MFAVNKDVKNAILIINPLASPAYLHEKFSLAGYYTIACFTDSKPEYLIKPIIDNQIFDKILFLSKDLEDDLTLINQFVSDNNLKIKYAFSSNEFDLPYSDKLVSIICPEFTNDPGTSLWRCNKRWMNLKLKDNGVPATRQTLVNSIEDVDWQEIKFPIIVKPAEGGVGAIGVLICNTREELESYFKNLTAQRWGHNFIPESFLIEELLIGEEYIVDMVAWHGQYYLIGMYYAIKEVHGPHKICRYRNFLMPNDPTAQQLNDYCSKVLKSLDVKYGMMHLECIMTKDGPRLIELNPRVSGASGMLNYFSEALGAIDQASLLIEMLENNGKADNISMPIKQGIIYYLQNFGFSYESVNEEILRRVNSYQRHLIKIPTQPNKSYPTNVFDTVAFVILTHNSSEQVQRDLQYLRTLEDSGELFNQI